MGTNSNDEYGKYRDKMMETGRAYQDFIVDVCGQLLNLNIVQFASRQYQFTVGESRNGIEIKNDNGYARTGNLYIEVAEKARPREGDFVASGICRNDNSWLLVIGDYNDIFIYDIPLLRKLAGTKKFPLITIKTGTSRGFLLRGKDVTEYCLRHLRPNAEEKILSHMPDLKKDLQSGEDLLALLKSDARQMHMFQDGADDAAGDDDDLIAAAISR